jgi:hypothetical protein
VALHVDAQHELERVPHVSLERRKAPGVLEDGLGRPGRARPDDDEQARILPGEDLAHLGPVPQDPRSTLLREGEAREDFARRR